MHTCLVPESTTTCSASPRPVRKASTTKERPREDRSPLSAATCYSRELEHYPVMPQDEQIALGHSITMHRKAIRQLASTVLLAIRHHAIPSGLLEPFISVSNSQGFSVDELRQAGHAITGLLAHVPTDLHIMLLDIQVQLQSPQETYAMLIDQLVSGNLRLVQRLVPAYLHEGTTREDLTQDGNLGLIKAAERYDPSAHTTTFSTYATTWIEQALQRSLNTNRPMYYPIEHLEDHRYVRQAQDELEAQLERSPTDLELVTHLNQQTIKRLELRLRRPASDEDLAKLRLWTVDRVRDHRTQSTVSLSLHDSTNDNDEPSLLDTLINHQVHDPERLYEQEQTALIIQRLLSTLTETERIIVTNLTGFDDEPLSITELSERLGMTRDKLRRLYRNTIEKMHEALQAQGYSRSTFAALLDGARP